MFNKKSTKIIGIVLLAIIILVNMGSSVMAMTVPEPDDNVNYQSFETPVKTILGLIKWGGLAVAVGMTMFIGIKYITASPDGKAEIKKTITYYVLGIVLLVSASAIVTAIQTNLSF